MSRSRASTAAPVLVALALVAGCTVTGLPDSVRSRSAVGRAWPDVVGPVGVIADGRRDTAVILSVEDYRDLPDRPFAHAIAGAWYRYLQEERDLRPRRIAWLRDGEVTPEAVRKAIVRAHWNVGSDATLWIIIVGHVGSSAALEHGVLLGATASGEVDPARDVRLAELLARGGHGYHRETVAVIDGCLPAPARSATLRSGVPAMSLPSLRYLQQLPETRVTIKPFGGGGVPITHDVSRRREPTDMVAFTAGVEALCVDALPGDELPALSYLVLGAVRGWADADKDGHILASEALLLVERLLRGAGGHEAVGRPEARGADIVLARQERERPQERPDLAPATLEAPPTPSPVAFVDDQMIKVDRGRFTVGCRSRRDPECEPDELPPRRVYLDSFAIDMYEVSWRKYAECVDAGVCSKVALAQCEVWTGEGFVRGAEIPLHFLDPELPVVCATWTQAAEYCTWVGKRLPTEVEWERAARGLTRSQYPWGDESPTCEHAQTYQCGYVTTPPGSHPRGASPEGVHDLAGNVSEWVDDWYDATAYRAMGRYNPSSPEKGEVRVVRGGSFYDGHGALRVSYRYGLSPQFGFGTVGFRCAR